MNVILVDDQDQPIGTMEKIEAHSKALLHRAFSVFIFNSDGEMLLQKRANEKYHSGGLWTNACCSHPGEGEVIDEASKRLNEEMGFTTQLEKAFTFIYKASFDNGLTEHEYDHVFIGYYDGAVAPDATEVSEYEWLSMEEVNKCIVATPNDFTAWFKIAFPMLEAYLLNKALQ